MTDGLSSLDAVYEFLRTSINLHELVVDCGSLRGIGLLLQDIPKLVP